MSAVILTKSYSQEPIAIDNIYEGATIETLEIQLDHKKWHKVYDKVRHCRICHKELNNWEKAINIQWHYDNKKKSKIPFRCYGCATND